MIKKRTKTSAGTSITANDIVKMLAVRHSEDVFVPECKDGPTWNGEHLRLDAWAMKRSWTRPCVWGYEIKVTRADFLNDHKAHAYLPLCNEFYFVAPPGIIDPSELPESVGLLVTAGTSRLLTKRKAAYRDVQIPDPLWRYILMSRAKITDDRLGIGGVEDQAAAKRERAARYKVWAEDRSKRKYLADLIGSELRHRLAELVTRNNRLEHYRKLTTKLDEGLRKIGINPEKDDWQAETLLAQFLAKMRGDCAPAQRAARVLINDLQQFLKVVDQVTQVTAGTDVDDDLEDAA